MKRQSRQEEKHCTPAPSVYRDVSGSGTSLPTRYKVSLSATRPPHTTPNRTLKKEIEFLVVDAYKDDSFRNQLNRKMSQIVSRLTM